MELWEAECEDGQDKNDVTVADNIGGYTLALSTSATMVSRRSWHERWFDSEVEFV